MKLTALSICLLLLSGCGDFPRDPLGTLERVRAERSFRVGMVAPLGDRPDAAVQRLLEQVAAASSARPVLVRGDSEPLLNRLEEGELDLVIGRFEAASPWATMVSFAPPLRVERQGSTDFNLGAAMRNGENGWIALVEAASRDSAEPQP